MRRKDLTYYINTVKLRIANRKFIRIKDSEAFTQNVKIRKSQYLQKYNKSVLSFAEFNLQYKTYFYFPNTDHFDNTYSFTNGFPTSLKGKDTLPLIPLYFGLVYINSKYNSADFDIDLLKRIGNHTLKHSKKRDEGLVLEHKFDYEIFGLKSPWISGITQSIACSFFCRLYALTNEPTYLSQAEQFLHPCTKEVGCLAVTKSGLEWVEEYKSNPSAFVLSGHIFAIIASGELFQISANSKYKFHTENWLRSLISELSSYQYKDYILHNKYQWKLSNLEYQGLYIGQFIHLYELTGNELFLELFKYYDKVINWNNFNRFYGIKR